MLSSGRIQLRAIEESDLQTISIWRSNPAVYEYFYEYLPISARQQKNWYEKQLSDSSEINLIIAKSDRSAIGTVSIYNIDRRNKRAEWGRLVIGDETARGNGIGAEAIVLIQEYCFEHLNLRKLYCEVLSSNVRAISLYKKFGFSSDGILRDHVFKNGVYQNSVLMSMLEHDYKKEKEQGALGVFIQRFGKETKEADN
jgi:diamine N-acetyltransferase